VTLESFDRGLERVVGVLVWIACALIPCIFTMIVIDVSIRTIGFTPPLFTSTVVEYALLYVAMFSAPWLVRQKGHVAIEAMVAMLPPAIREGLAKAVYFVCAFVAAYFTWLSIELFFEAIETGNLDVRGIDMPYWLQFLPMPFGYGLVSLEFLMFLLGLRHYYTYDLGEVKDSV
jgi:TRAP-type C4-dicarboxylate transport system permease small subunit